MADSVVNITAGTGTGIDTRTNAAGEHRQVTVLGNDGDVVAGLEPFGALQVNNGSQTWFYDAWDVSPIDTTDKWTVTGTTPAVANGVMTMSPTVSTYNAIRTKDTIRANVGFALVRNGITLETAVGTGAGRFWGLGTPASTPAPAVLAQDGIGFEIDQAAGSLLAVTYAAGVRTTVATLTRPTDGANHAYHLYFRVTQAYWFIDGITVAVASLAFPNVQVAQLPALIVRQNAATLTNAPVFTNMAHLTADTSRQGTVISDPVIGTRQARVKAASTAAVATDSAMVVALHPSNPTPAGTNLIGLTRPVLSATGTLTQVASTITASTTLLAANTARLGAMVFNDSTSLLYLSLAATCTTTAHTVQVAAGGMYEVPPAYSYTGIITGTWASANGSARVTEMT